MCVGAFGSGGFGSVPFGLSDPMVSIGVVQLSLNSVLVTLSGIFAVEDPLAPDPLEPSLWLLARVDPMVPGSTLPLVQAVEAGEDSSSVVVYFDAPMTPGQGYSLDYVGDSCAVAATFVAYAPGNRSIPTGDERPNGRFDLANPSYQADASGNVVRLGTLQVDASGDLAIETGVPYLRKRIVRRLTTPRGAFLHLLNYGLRIPEKRNMTQSEVFRLKTTAEAQIREEPDVRAVAVSISQPVPGSVILFVRVQTVAGLTDEFSFEAGGR